jgi:hypothetical protein
LVKVIADLANNEAAIGGLTGIIARHFYNIALELKRRGRISLLLPTRRIMLAHIFSNSYISAAFSHA